MSVWNKMIRRFGLLSISFSLLLTFTSLYATPQPDETNWKRLPLAFIPNQGQSDQAILFQVHSLGGVLSFTSDAVALSLPQTTPQSLFDTTEPQPQIAPLALKLQFVGANAHPTLHGLDALQGEVNYLLGDNPAQWQTQIPTYGGVVYNGLYPGIDLNYDGQEGLLKGTFIVQPEGDYSQIRWRYAGADKVVLDSNSGDLHLTLPNGNILAERAPTAWQAINGMRVPVAIAYVLQDDNSIGFTLGTYDPAYTLYLDPTLEYSTYLGGSSSETAADIAVGPDGSAYVVGGTVATNFPTQNPLQPANAGDRDIFVVKLNPAGSAFEYATYIGGADYDTGYSIGVDHQGNAYVAGSTASTNFPIKNALDKTFYQGYNDIFVLKLNPTGTALIYSTYLGGTGGELALSLALGNDNSVYLTGATNSTDYPTSNAYQETFAGGGNDIFVSRLNPSGSALLFSTYLGTPASEYSLAIAVDGANQAYITGTTQSADFPLVNPYDGEYNTPSNCQPMNGNCDEGYVARFSATGQLTYSTYLGGSGYEGGQGIAVDSRGSFYVTGYTTSLDFPTVNAFQAGTTQTGSFAFVTKFNPSGSALEYSTYLGDPGGWDEGGMDIAVDADGNAYVTGTTRSDSFPLVSPIQSKRGGSPSWDATDVFVSKFTADGRGLLFSTYLGGSADEYNQFVPRLALDATNNIYIAGQTYSADFPVVKAVQPVHGGVDEWGFPSGDGFVAKISLPAQIFTVTTTDDMNNGDCTLQLCSLRDAIRAANAAGGGTIIIPAGMFQLSIPGTNEEAAATGDLDITTDVVISGAGAADTLIDGAALDRVFHIQNGAVATLVKLTVQNGLTGPSERGAGILNENGRLSLSSVTVSGNTAQFSDGGISNHGTLLITNSSIIYNTAGSNGGLYNSGSCTIQNSSISQNTAALAAGIANDGGQMSITRSTISGNIAQSEGGGLLNYGQLSITDTTISSNQAQFGGGIYSALPTASLQLEKSTVSGNTSTQPHGGSVFTGDSTATIINSTIASNVGDGVVSGQLNGGTTTITFATIAGNSGHAVYNNLGTLTLQAALLAEHSTGNCPADGGTITSSGYNLSDDTSCTGALNTTGDKNNANPLLDPLQDNGGYTQTRALRLSSPAINTIPYGVCDPVTTDQRGYSRGYSRFDNPCDMGAYEAGSRTFVVTTTDDTNDGNCDTHCSLREAINAANVDSVRDNIAFNIPGTGPFTIRPTSALPTPQYPTYIDATTQPGYRGQPLIELDGSLAGPNVNGFTITKDVCRIHGFVINRFDGSGIYVAGRGHVVVGLNYIGTDVTGTAALGNRIAGIYVNQGYIAHIGGDDLQPGRNLISGNGVAGIVIKGYYSSSAPQIISITGNYIGTDVTGTTAIPNGSDSVADSAGIWLTTAYGLTIGGNEPGDSNLISGNRIAGINIRGGRDNAVVGNLIGTNAAGTAALGNSQFGIHVSSPKTTIGGTTESDWNTIAYNNGAGISIAASNEYGVIYGVGILGNRIYANYGLGIDLQSAEDGVTPNDSADADVGANYQQNYPIISKAVFARGSLSITGNLESSPDETYRLQFYASDTCDPAGYGEGQQYIGSTEVTTAGNSLASFNTTLDITNEIGPSITATAIDSVNNTSEFSACVTLTAAAPDLISPANGAQITYTQPYFEWSEISGISEYEFVLKKVDSQSQISLILNATQYLPAPLLPGTYEWRVRTSNASNSPWSDTRSFTILSETNAAPERNLFATTTPTLHWGSVSWATEYQIQISLSPTFGPASYAHTATVTADHLEYTLPETNALPGHGIYYWRVRAQRPGYVGAWSSTERFQVDIP